MIISCTAAQARSITFTLTPPDPATFRDSYAPAAAARRSSR
jgi:hypothetical protein